MGKPPTTDQELSARVAALEDRADATDAAIASLHADLDVTNADVSMLIGRTDELDARVTALEELVTTGKPPVTEPPIIGGGPIIPPDRPDHTLPVPEPQPPEVTPPTTGRAVTILLDGQSHLFTQEGGIDVGAYTDPQGRFTQHCIAARCDTLADFTVFFRPDAAGGREEVVFEFGRCFGNPPGAVLGAYSAVITRDGETLADIAVPQHYYYSRWRWQSAPRPVTARAADLIAAKLVPDYDKTLVPGMRAGVHTDDGPMAPNGITTYMPSTGERDDIGILTESQADYLMYEDAQGLGTVRAWLEGSGTFPWHYRDETTLAPIDFVNTWPLASSFYYGGNTWSGDNPHLPSQGDYQNDLTADVAHEPSLAYVPFLLTGDPYALEELQFVTTGDYCRQSTSKNFCMGNALRGYAWHLRNIAHCVAATPASVPSWLQPKAYWQTYLDSGLEFSHNAGPDMAVGTYQQRFQDMSPGLNTYGELSGFMEDYAMAVFLHVVDLGFTGWDTMRDWKLQGVIARTNGTSGYNRSIPTAYIRVVTEGSPAAPVLADWAALQAWNAGPQGYDNQGGYYTPNDPTQAHLYLPNVSLGYCSYTLACLNWAERQGVAEATPCAAWLRSEMAGKIPYMRWAIA